MGKKHEALFRRFKADEASPEISGPYPQDDDERPPVHEHVSSAPAAAGGTQ